MTEEMKSVTRRIEELWNTGSKVEWTGMTIYRMDSGKIVETWWNEDTLGLMNRGG